MTDSLPSGSLPSESQPFRCSDAARARGDQLTGTAPPATRWLLIEYPGPWAVDALGGSSIDPTIQQQLRAAAGRARARLLLIRRPERRASAAPERRLWAVLGRGAPAATGSWGDDGDLSAAARALDDPTNPTADPTDDEPESGDQSAPMILVCAHGVHDVCCAVRGRPVARALAEVWPDQTWECSHVGGDRFAPNVVILPDGVYYGDLDPESARSVVADHLAGVVRTDHLRGFSGYPPPVQAAMAALYRRLDPATARGLAYRDHDVLDDGGWRVRFGLEQAAPVVEISAAAAEPTRLTCRAVRATSATDYRVELITGLPTSVPA